LVNRGVIQYSMEALCSKLLSRGTGKNATCSATISTGFDTIYTFKVEKRYRKCSPDRNKESRLLRDSLTYCEVGCKCALVDAVTMTVAYCSVS